MQRLRHVYAAVEKHTSVRNMDMDVIGFEKARQGRVRSTYLSAEPAPACRPSSWRWSILCRSTHAWCSPRSLSSPSRTQRLLSPGFQPSRTPSSNQNGSSSAARRCSAATHRAQPASGQRSPRTLAEQPEVPGQVRRHESEQQQQVTVPERRHRHPDQTDTPPADPEP